MKALLLEAERELVFDGNLPELLITDELCQSAIPAIFIRESWTIQDLNEAYSSAEVLGILQLGQVKRHLTEIVLKQHQNLQQVSQQKKLIRSAAQNLRELETLNRDLEKMVGERTQHIRRSQMEEEQKANLFRELTVYAIELSKALSLEEALDVFRKSFKKVKLLVSIFYWDRDRILVLQAGQKKEVLFSNRGEGLFVLPEKVDLGAYSKSQLEKKITKPLAQILQRPVLPSLVLSVPTQDALVGVELGIDHDETEDLLNFFEERASALVLTIQKLNSEVQIRNSAKRWEKTFDSVKEPIAIINSNYEVVRANGKFRKFEGKKCFELLMNRQTVCENCVLGKESTVQGASRELWDLRSYPLHSQGSQPHYIHFYREQNVEKSLEAQWMLAKRMSVIADLAGNLAHDLNNPLSGLRSLAQYWIAESKNESWKSDLSEIERAAERSQLLIQNLVAFSGGEPAEQSSQVAVDFDEQVRKTLPLLKVFLRGLNVQTHLRSEKCQVVAQSILLQQVIYNLIKNAAQAQRDRPGAILIKSDVQEGEWLEFSVQDQGPGISDEQIQNLFQPFFTTKKTGEGSGLGLYFSRTVIEKFGGKIGVESAVNIGSRFWFRLPLAESRDV